MTTAAADSVDVAAEVEAVDRVLFRLSTVTESSLAGVLDNLLPLLLEKMKDSAAPPLRAKLIETFTHISARVKSRPIALPFAALVSMLQADSGGRSQAAFLNVYLRMCMPVPGSAGSTDAAIACPRGSPEAYEAAALSLLDLANFPPSTRDVACQLLWRLLPRLTLPPLAVDRARKFSCLLARSSNAPPAASEAEAATSASAQIATPAAPAGPSQSLELLAPFLRDILLSAPGALAREAAAPAVSQASQRAAAAAADASAVGTAAAAAAGSAAAAATGAPAGPATVTVPAGMSLRGFAALHGVPVTATAEELHAASRNLTAADLAAAKKAIVRLITCPDLLPTSVTVPLCVVAAEVGAGNADVGEPAEDLLKRCVSVQHRDVEDAGLVKTLASLVLGSGAAAKPAAAAGAGAAAAAPAPADPDVRSPCSVAVQARALHLLARSRAATTTFPLALQLTMAGLFGKGATAKLKLLAVAFTQQSVLLTDPVLLRKFAPLLLNCLMEALSKAAPTSANDGDSASSPAAEASGTAAAVAAPASAAMAAVAAGEAERLRESLYAAVGVLCARLPDVQALRALRVPALLFSRLASEASTLRLAVAEALSNVAVVFRHHYSAPAAANSAATASATASPSPAPAVTPEQQAAERLALYDMLAPYATHREVRVRLAVLDWATRCFPFADVRARALCLRMVGDSSAEVRALARAGLVLKSAIAQAHHLGGGGAGRSAAAGAAGADKTFRGRDGDADRSDLGALGPGAGAAAGSAAVPGGSSAAPASLIGQPRTGTGRAGADTGLVFDSDNSSGARAAAGAGDDVDGSPLSPGADADAADVGEDEDAALLRRAALYPSFPSLLQYLCAGGSSGASAVAGGAATSRAVASGEEQGPAKRARTHDDSPGVATIPPSSPAAQMSCLSLAGALQFLFTCLDASAALARCSVAEYLCGAEASASAAAAVSNEMGVDGDSGGSAGAVGLAAATSTGATSASSSSAGGAGGALLASLLSLIDTAMRADSAQADATTLHETATKCAARLVAATPPSAVAARFSSPAQLSWLLARLRESSKGARPDLAFIVGAAVAALPHHDGSAEAACTLPASSVSAVAAAAGQSAASAIGNAPTTLTAGLALLARLAGLSDARSSALQHGALLALGCAQARVPEHIASLPSVRPSVQLALEAVLQQLGHSAASVREAAVGTLTAVCRAGGLRLPLVIDSHSGRAVTATAAAAAEAALLDAAHAALAEKSRAAVLACYIAAVAVGQVGGGALASSASASVPASAPAAGASEHTLVVDAATSAAGTAPSRLALTLQLFLAATGVPRMPKPQAALATAAQALLSGAAASAAAVGAGMGALIAAARTAAEVFLSSGAHAETGLGRRVGTGAAAGGGAADVCDDEEDSALGSASLTEAAAVCLGSVASAELRASADAGLTADKAPIQCFLTAAVGAAAASSAAPAMSDASPSAAGDSSIAVDDVAEPSLYDDEEAAATAPAAPAGISTGMSSFSAPGAANFGAAALAVAALTALAPNRSEGVQFTVSLALVEAITAAPAPAGSAAASFAGAGAQGVAAASGDFALGSGSQASGIALAGSTGSYDSSAPPRLPAAAVQLRDALAGALLDAILSTALQSIKAHERGAAAVWLLSLCHGMAAASKASAAGSRSSSGSSSGGGGGGGGDAAATFACLQSRLALLQTAFTRLLGERSASTQETAARGLAVLYDAAGDGGVKQRLLSSLLATFDTGKKHTMAAPGALATAAGAAAGAGAGAVGTSGPGPAGIGLSSGGDGAYKEMCAMASEVGQPDLIYQLLALSARNATWHSRGGAAFGLEALLSGSARRALAPHLRKLIPRLFRYSYDPAARVREPMTRLWGLLVRDPRKAVAAHIHAILPEVIAASAAPEWRQREGAVCALADALQGRSAEDVAPHLDALWRAVMRALDDEKDEVRAAAALALKTLAALSVRICDATQTPGSAGRGAVATMLPFLLNEGLKTHDAAARSACVGVLRDVCGVAGPLLRPHLPELVHTALIAMSELESGQAAYAQAHANAGQLVTQSGLRISGEALEAARLEAARSGPLADVLAACLTQLRTMPPAELDPGLLASPAGGGAGAGGDDAETAGAGAATKSKKGSAAAAASAAAESPPCPLRTLATKLADVVAHGINVPSRGGAARFIIALVRDLGDTLKGQALLMMKPLLAALGDASPLLRKEFATAAAALARVCKTGTVSRLVTRLGELARSGEDAGLRVAAGRGFRELARQAGERVRAHSSEVVPLVFLACHDPDAGVREAFSDAWETLASSPEQALRLYLPETVAAIGESIDASAWVVKRQGAGALITLLRTLVGTRAAGFVGPAIAGAAKAAEAVAAGPAAAKTTEGVGVLSNTSAVSGGAALGSGDGASSAVRLPTLPMPYLTRQEYSVESGTALPPTTAVGAAASTAAVSADGDGSSSSSSVASTGMSSSALTLKPAAAASVAVDAHLRRAMPSQCVEMVPHTAALLPRLLAAIPGKAWDGKETLVIAAAELAARTVAAFADVARDAAPGSAASGAGGAGAAASASAVRVTPLLVLLAVQAKRSSAALAYVAACVSGLALVCAAFAGAPAALRSCDAATPVGASAADGAAAAGGTAPQAPPANWFVLVRGAALQLLARLGRVSGDIEVLPGGSAAHAGGASASSGSAAASAGAGAAAALGGGGSGIVGMRVDEARAATGRTLARAAAAEEETAAGACYIAMAAAAVAVLTASQQTGADAAAPGHAALARSAVDHCAQLLVHVAASPAASGWSERVSLCKGIALLAAGFPADAAGLLAGPASLALRLLAEEDKFAAVKQAALQCLTVVARALKHSVGQLEDGTVSGGDESASIRSKISDAARRVGEQAVAQSNGQLVALAADLGHAAQS